MEAKLIKIDRNGSKYYEGLVTCDRCQGRGEYWWGAMTTDIGGGEVRPQYSGVCFKCGGAGKVTGKWIERTPEYQAKLDARRQAKWEAKQAEAERIRKEAEAKAEAERLAEEARIKAQKAISQYVGEVGQRLTIKMVGHYSATFETRIGWKTETMHIHIMRDENGNAYKWATQNSLGYYVEDEKGWMIDKGKRWSWHSIEEDETFVIVGTVKDHSEYKDEKQTVLTRCKVKRAEEA